VIPIIEADIKEKLNEVLSHYSGEKDELIPILQEAQENFGYLPAEVMQRIAKFLHLPESAVFGVSTFYAQFKLVPSGKRTVRVCRGTACHVRGGARILREVEKRLGIKPGETTSDLEYTLETVACIGACALAPTMTVAKETHGQMTTKKVAEVFGDRSKAG
jgi:NADH-quinone oxidoreductase subunit E